MAPTPESLAAAAERLEAVAPGYLETIRRRASALSLPRTPEERVRRMVEQVARAAPVNADAPSASPRRSVRLAKRGVATLVRFYMLHLAGQVATLGGSTALMGEALCDYVAGLEREVAGLEREVGELRARVARLEQPPAGP